MRERGSEGGSPGLWLHGLPSPGPLSVACGSVNTGPLGSQRLGGRQVPAPKLQSVPLSKKRGAWGDVRPWRWGHPITHLNGDGMSKMQLLGGHKGFMLKDGEPGSGHGA